jgi:hypothetical protein
MIKWPLLVLIGVTILTMIGFPGCYDSKRRMAAHARYYASPNEVTRNELHEAKLADWKDIVVYEAALAGVLLMLFWLYFRVEKAVTSHEN